MDRKKIEEILTKIKHPAINRNLVDLGIIRDFSVKGDKVKIIFAFPSPNVPIKEQIIQSVREPIEKTGLSFKAETTVMNQEELQKFLTLEKKNWKGL